MFYLRNPTRSDLDAIAREHGHLPFTQPGVGATRRVPLAGTGSDVPDDLAPPGFAVDRYGVIVGRGQNAFERACAAVRRFAMYPPGWTRVHLPDGDETIREGGVFVAVVRHFGFYSAMPCRIVYPVDESGPVQHFGFALGTVSGHPESGEERFWVSWDTRDDTVRYDVVAFSRPRHFLARLGYPLARMLQKRFARDSRANMIREVSGP